MTIRKPSVVFATVAFLILAAAPMAHAGGSIFGGVNFPTGEFNDGASTGWNLGGYYTAGLIPLVEIGGLVAYNDFSGAMNFIPDEIDDIFGYSINAWGIEDLGQVNLLFMRGFLGLGIANSTGIDEEGGSDRKTNFAWQVGLAMKFLMLEGRLGYHQINAEQSSPNWVGLTVGLVF